MRADKIETNDSILKEKIEIIYCGVDDTARDIESHACCSGSFFALRG